MQWIKASERRPEIGKPMLVFIKSKFNHDIFPYVAVKLVRDSKLESFVFWQNEDYSFRFCEQDLWCEIEEPSEDV